MNKVKITDVCEIQVGKTPSRSNPSYWGDGSLWLSIADMNQGITFDKTKETITEKAIKECKCKIVPKDTVLFSFKLSIGKVGITKVPMYTNEAIAAFIIKDPSKLNTKFLSYVLKSVDYSIGSNKAAMGKTLNKEKLKKFEIPLPSFKDQVLIVKRLDRADSLCQKRNQTISLLDDYLKSVFLEMFGDLTTNTKGWPRKKLGELAKISSGGTPSRDHEEYYKGDIPWVKTTEVNGHLIQKTQECITKVGLKNSSCHLYPKGSIIIAMYGQGKTRGQVGVLGIEATTNQACGVLYPDKSYNTTYIFQLLQYSYENLRSLGRGGNQPNLNSGILKNYQVIFPPIELQIKFAKIVERTEVVKQKMEFQLIELENQFQALMQKSFNCND